MKTAEARCQMGEWLALLDDFRNYFYSEECLQTAQLVEAVA